MNLEQTKQSIYFTLNANIDGREVTPSTIGFSSFNSFNHEVEEFVAGSQKKVSTKDVHVVIEEGSCKLVVLLPVTVEKYLIGKPKCILPPRKILGQANCVMSN